MAQSTSDYKKFKFLEGNRQVNQAHLKKLARSIALYPDLLPSRPILVNENFEIIDGQHRFTACEQLGLPIYYEVEQGLKASDAVALNRNQRNWGVMDYAHSFALAGNKDYQTFLDIQEEYKLAPSIVMMYLRGGNTAGRTAKFREGEFVIMDEQLGRQRLDYLKDLAAFNNHFKKSRVAEPALTVFKNDGYDHDRMLNKMALYGDVVFKPYGTAKDIIRSLEDTYNFRQRQDLVRF